MKRRRFFLLGFLAALWPKKANAAVDVQGPYIRLTGSNVSIPQFTIGWKILRSQDRSELEDATEGKTLSVTFPNVWTVMTDEEKRDLLEHISRWFLQKAIERNANK